MSRIATVFGATGKQGSSVVRALLADGTFKPRAVTRDPNSPAAKKLVEQGAEVVQADMADKDAVKKAVTGAEVVFLVTAPFTSTTEVVQGTNIIDGSKATGVKFLVFSTLPSIKGLSNGKYPNVSVAEEKVQIQAYLEASGIPHACIGTGSFLENLLVNHLGLPPFSKTDTGYVMHSYGKPDMTFTWTWIGHDMGPAVTALFKNYETRKDEVLGQTFVLGVARATVKETAAEFAKGLGKPVEVKCLEKCEIPMVNDMYAFTVEYEWYPGVPVPDTRLEKLGVKMGTAVDFAKAVLKPHLGE
ncbi:hypothetical protein GGF50DRAFT_110379 [Schizophyllum commune]